MATNNRISDIVKTQLPYFVRNDHAAFTAFVEAYYEYLESENKLVDRSKNLYKNFDIDQTIDAFAEKFYNHLLHLIPDSVITDKNVLVKHIKDFYRARGTEKSIQFLLQILFGKDSSLYYPKRDILKVSDGKWFIEKSLRVQNIRLNNTLDDSIATVKRFINKSITGNTSGATATVEKVDVYFEQSELVNELKLSGQLKNFTSGETVFAVVEIDGTEYSLTGEVFAGFISEVQILSAGSGYEEGTTISLTGNTGTGGSVQIANVTKGSLTTIAVISGGAGFQANDFVFITSLSGSGANGKVGAVNTDETYHPNTYNIDTSTIATYANTLISDIEAEEIANLFTYFEFTGLGPAVNVALSTGGNNYLSLPYMDIQSNTIIRSMGILGRMEIIDGGEGYANGDAITFENVLGGYGTGAAGNVASVNGTGAIETVEFVEVEGFGIGGFGYDQAHLPNVVITSANGTNANVIVTAILGDGETLSATTDTIGAIQSIIILTPGSGYTESPLSINLTAYGDGTAQAQALVVSGVYTYPGRYLSDDGFVSGYNFIQDNKYYQNYSYVVQIRESINKYRKALKDLIHPAGLLLFGEYVFTDNNMAFSANTTAVSTGNTGTVIFKLNKTYESFANTSNANNIFSYIQVTYESHGLNANDVVYLDFTSGDTGNVQNGSFIVTESDANTFNVIYISGTTTSGNVDVGIIT